MDKDTLELKISILENSVKILEIHWLENKPC